MGRSMKHKLDTRTVELSFEWFEANHDCYWAQGG